MGWSFSGKLWRHLLIGADGDWRFMSLDGSRLEYKLDSRKLEWYKSKCPGGLSHAHAGWPRSEATEGVCGLRGKQMLQ